jgi:hypothetical protein
MFVRVSPYFPFSARVCLNQHHWLANQLRSEGISFQQCSNAFLKCGNPARLQELADSLKARDLAACGEKWLTRFTPLFTDQERTQLDHPRQLALMHALVRFSHIAAGNTFTTTDLHPHAAALGGVPDEYRLSSLRYELSKLRAKGLVEKLRVLVW